MTSTGVVTSPVLTNTAVMTNTSVDWGLGAALVIVASGAIWRLARPSDRSSQTHHQRTNSVLHLLMALAMTVMLVERGGAVAQALGVVFGAVAVAMLARGRLHHAVMCGIMVLMVRMPSGPGSSPAMNMHMSMSMAPTPVGQGVSLLVLAAFGYVAVSACVFVWRMRASGGEIAMLVSTAVMLLPMI
ncbi:MAG TPA: DUF5134 domain-containing protein [Actinocrinis sp.]|nr:DUF5134 domain-containing protein [Actinocrinis sp.]